MTWKKWLYGALAALGTGLVSGLSAWAALPDVINLSKAGIIAALKVILLPAILAGRLYVARTPAPTIEIGEPNMTPTRKLGAIALMFLIVSSLFASGTLMTGCTSQQTIAELVSTLGNAGASIAAGEGNTALAQKLQADVAAASSQILNWQSGTAAQDVIEALNLVEDDLQLFPVTSQEAALIDLALGTVQAIITEVTSKSSSSSTAPTAEPVSAHTRTAVRVVHLAKTPKNKGEFKKRWNAAVKANPSLTKYALK